MDTKSIKDPVKEVDNVNFNIFFLKKSLKLLMIFFPAIIGQSSILLLFILIIGLLKEFIVYQVGLVASKYFDCLPKKDFNLFIQTTVFAIFVIIGIAVTMSIGKFLSDMLAISTRRNLTRHLHELYCKDNGYYFLNFNKKFDNIDQRFTQDINKVTSQLASIIFVILSTPILVAFYAYKTAEMAGWLGPVSALVFFLIFSLINKLILNWVSKSVFELEKCEGNFRYKHVTIRNNSDGIALLNCIGMEKRKLNEMLEYTLAAQCRVAVRSWVLNLITTLGDYVGSILTYLAIGFAIFTGMYFNKSSDEIAVIISKTSFFLLYLVNKFTQFLDMANNAAIIVGITYRVANILEELENRSAAWRRKINSYQNENIKENSLKPLGHQEYQLCIQNLTAKFPFSAQNTFIKDLNIVVNRKDSLLIKGESGCGKSSLIRCLAELWPITDGYVTWATESPKLLRHPSVRIILPQVPYFTNGTLLEQVILPEYINNIGNNITSVELNEIVKLFSQLSLTHLIERFGLQDTAVIDWSKILSPGEQQRLSILRILYHKPDIVFLDEATSQVSEELQQHMYQLIRSVPNITVVSVGHRNTLKTFHTHALTLTGTGDWSFDIQ